MSNSETLTEGQIRYRRYKKTYEAYRKKYSLSDMQREHMFRGNDNKFFGGNKKLALERDNYTCQKCGMTEEQHIAKFNRRITVDHIDGNGRNALVKNNNLDNLMTLCSSCHSMKDARRQWARYRGEVREDKQ